MNEFINRENELAQLEKQYAPMGVGRQWSSAYEIDVAAVNSEFELTMVGECKWSEHKLGLSTLRELEEKVSCHDLPVAKSFQCVLFSKSGFTQDLEKFAGARKNIILTTGLSSLKQQPTQKI